MSDILNGWDVSHLVMHSAFDELHEASIKASCSVSVDDYIPMACLVESARIESKQGKSRKHLVKAVALFQAGMEALISHWTSKYPELSAQGGFVKMWESAFQAKGITETFEDYAIFYRVVRNAIIHPDSDERVSKINNLNYIEVFQGIQSGWEAFRLLGNALGENHEEGSWQIMCDSHSVPSVEEGNFPDLMQLRGELIKKNMAHHGG